MDNLEYLKGIKDKEFKGIVNVETRGVKALEIIAEELVNNNSTLRTLVTTLENIDTTLNRR